MFQLAQFELLQEANPCEVRNLSHRALPWVLGLPCSPRKRSTSKNKRAPIGVLSGVSLGEHGLWLCSIWLDWYLLDLLVSGRAEEISPRCKTGGDGRGAVYLSAKHVSRWFSFLLQMHTRAYPRTQHLLPRSEPLLGSFRFECVESHCVCF